jgi:hypothetical protein
MAGESNEATFAFFIDGWFNGIRESTGNELGSRILPGLVNVQKTMERSTIFNG